ncbi:class I SAM-dependent methyltransferase [Pseudalkalibacillus sp. SCS-8]|uniref:class I SAM-dependent methyltransferase n=1 Tax=Pseudalkalibacillus nanhaiensis TaxID=3115291 RepID=UPI0032D9E73B
MKKTRLYKRDQESIGYIFQYAESIDYHTYYERPATLSLIPDVERKDVLDAGCGTGWYSEWLAKHDAYVTAIDSDENMVKETKARIFSRGNVLQADLNQPLGALKDHSFDLIISSLTMHYIKDWEKPMKEFNRILRNKGRLIFSVIHPFLDYTRFPNENYFSLKQLTEVQASAKYNNEINLYLRPLNEIIKPLYLNGFIIERIIEPLPTEEFRRVHPKEYEDLMKHPHFLFIRAQKMTSL